MPPCKTVLINKINRTNYLARMIKCSSQNIIDAPENGWFMNESGELEIEYFTGSPYPETITDIACAEIGEEEEETRVSSDDEGESDEDADDEDWNPK